MGKKALIGEPIVARFLSGPTSGIEMIGDYSVTPETFSLGPAEKEVWQLQRLTVYIQDTGNFNVASYGNGITLTNGIELKLFEGETEIANFQTSSPIKSNADWGRFCFNNSYLNFGQGDNAFIARWDISPNFVWMHGIGTPDHPTAGNTVRVTLNDDFSGLTSHTFLLEGNIVEPDRGTV